MDSNSDYNLNIELIFPTAIGIVDNDNFEDHSTLLDLEYKVTEASHGQFEQSEDTYVLDNHVPNLRNWIQQQVDNYSKYALSTHQKLKFWDLAKVLWQWQFFDVVLQKVKIHLQPKWCHSP